MSKVNVHAHVLSPASVVVPDAVDASDVNVPPQDEERKEKLRVDEDGEVHPVFDETGRYEMPDPVPVAPPVGYKKQPSMFDIVRDAVRSERLRAEVEAAGFETFEDADDFVVGDDFDPHSPYENEFNGLPISELRSKYADGVKAEEEMRKRFEAAKMQNNGDASNPPAPPSPQPDPVQPD